MYKIETEIFEQYGSLAQTYDYLVGHVEEIKEFWEKGNFRSITFIGCGSSYSLCKSAEISAKLLLGCPANSIPGGDVLLNFTMYEELLKGSLLIIPSRSGSTSEIVNVAKLAKEQLGSKCIAISAVKASELSRICDMSFELPWAFDESVCQTRTVTNLYMADLMIVGAMAGNTGLLQEIKEAVNNEEQFIKQNTEKLKAVAEKALWDKVIVLSDGELKGIGDEGSLAFKEISQLQSNHYHILDVRHGPMVLIDERTLLIIACSPYSYKYQHELINDIKKKKATVVTVSSEAGDSMDSDLDIKLKAYKNYGVNGIPFIFISQAISYFRAMKDGLDPGNPPGLDPWIKL
ncbi:MAG TPA: SIS domain-containing protein [Candidatus Nitrosocosmicus sp.]|nr:SIS domain-containing protein [Candidatus Nitrosocosmicus sp.]